MQNVGLVSISSLCVSFYEKMRFWNYFFEIAFLTPIIFNFSK